MKIALIGYGKMGKEIEKMALRRNHSIHIIIDLNNTEELKSEKFSECDVAIEFTSPSAVLSNIYSAFEANVPIVTGTTGWHNKLDQVSAECEKNGTALFHTSNFSIGVNLFFAVNEYVADIMNNFPDYNVSMEESHHIHKLDAPSGTAISLANIILNKLDRKSSWSLTGEKPEVIPIKAIRKGEITGIHTLKYESEEDFIELTHHAKSRKGFALGAVMAAEFLKNKKGVYTMSDLLGI